MGSFSRRNFLRKNILGGALIASGAPIFYGFSDIEPFKEQSISNFKNSGGKIDWQQVRASFLFPEDRKYLNTASLGPSPKNVVDTLCESIHDLDSKCSHGHHLSDTVHEKFAQFLNVNPEEIAFTRNATEGMNIIARSLRLKRGDEVIITTHEHVGGAAPWLALKNDIGINIILVDLDLDGAANYKRIEAAISDRTKAIAFSHITCTTGMKLPVKEIAELCHTKGIYSCVDGAQALGMFPIDLTDLNPDFYTGSGHKWMFGPKGTGVLYIKKEHLSKIHPVYVGAYSDNGYSLNELKLAYRDSAQREEYGTRNASIILALGASIDFLNQIGMNNVAKRGQQLTSYLRNALNENENIEILTPVESKFSASILTFRINGEDNLAFNQKINSEHHLRLRGIYENDLDAIRVSCSIFNSEQELDKLIAVLKG